MNIFKTFRNFLKGLFIGSGEPCLEETTLCARSGNKVYVGFDEQVTFPWVFGSIITTFSVKSFTYIVPKDRLDEDEKMYGPSWRGAVFEEMPVEKIKRFLKQIDY